jgi:hypothetical protein
MTKRFASLTSRMSQSDIERFAQWCEDMGHCERNPKQGWFAHMWMCAWFRALANLLRDPTFVSKQRVRR